MNNSLLALKRLSLGYSQEQVSKVLNVRQAAISHYESGKATPKYKYAKQLAELYGMNVDDFYKTFFPHAYG